MGTVTSPVTVSLALVLITMKCKIVKSVNGNYPERLNSLGAQPSSDPLSSTHRGAIMLNIYLQLNIHFIVLCSSSTNRPSLLASYWRWMELFYVRI